MAKRTFGCSSIINAVNLQFELAGHGVYTDLKRNDGATMWLCEHAIKRDHRTALMKSWMEQAPESLCGRDTVTTPRVLSWPKSIS